MVDPDRSLASSGRSALALRYRSPACCWHFHGTLRPKLRTPGFLEYFLLGEHFKRFLVSGWEGDLYGTGHARPFGIIWIYWLGAFLPWTFFTPPLLLTYRPDRTAASSEGQAVACLSGTLGTLSAHNVYASPQTSCLPTPCRACQRRQSSSYHCGHADMPDQAGFSGFCFGCAIGAVLLLFALVSVLALVAPQSLKLKTERDLVNHAQTIHPDIRFTYWGERSFSADFYTRNTADYTILTSEIIALSHNSLPDAVAVHRNEAVELSPLLATKFEAVGEFGRRVPLYRKSRRGARFEMTQFGSNPSIVAAALPLPQLSFVIPAFNEEANIEKTIRRVDEAARGLVRRFEIIVVDDGSTDQTFDIAKKITGGHPPTNPAAFSQFRERAGHHGRACSVRGRGRCHPGC